MKRDHFFSKHSIRTLCLSLILLLTVGFITPFAPGAYAQTTVQIGTDTVVDQHLPIEPYYGYTYSQSIYKPGDMALATPFQIEKIGYYYSVLSTSHLTKNLPNRTDYHIAARKH